MMMMFVRPIHQKSTYFTQLTSGPCVVQRFSPRALWDGGGGVPGAGGSCLRLIDSCITQLKAQGPSRTCNESKEEEGAEMWGPIAQDPRP